jgi:hypothetical protein
MISPSLFRQDDAVPDIALLPEMPQKTVVVTSTLYDPSREIVSGDAVLRMGLAYELFVKARGLGYDVVTVDGGSPGAWLSGVRDLGVVVLEEDISERVGLHPMGKARRQALEVAGNLGTHDVIYWTEPEKHPLFDQRGPVEHAYALAMMSAVVAGGKGVIAIGKRKDGLQSYPAQQRFCELAGNFTITSMLDAYLKKVGIKEGAPYLDHWNGPRAISRDALDLFLQYDGTIGGVAVDDRWGMHTVAPWIALAQQLPVKGVVVDYTHPVDQTAFEENPDCRALYDKKRIDQLTCLVDTCRTFVEHYRPS